MTIPPQQPQKHPFDTLSRRPATLDPAELGFTPREQVAWLSPTQLAATGIRVALAAQFGAYLDKRELQVSFPTRIFDEHAEDDELWLDYVADTGDGFDATYSVAYLLAQEQLQVDGEQLPRAQVLVMGGDQVYPTASSAGYEDRLEGPYHAAFPGSPADDAATPTLFALPGNHDWYDGLTAFLRLFARRGGAKIGAWRTQQTRSYFALKLPHRWWLLALDAQDADYIDDPQLEYFKGVTANFAPGDRVVLLTPQPSWVHGKTRPRFYDTIDYFLRNVLEPAGADVALMLSGDLHHFARYTLSGTDTGMAERHLITCGGGGAYLSATHQLPRKITVPPDHSRVRREGPANTYELRDTYPTRERSRWLSTGVFGRLPWRNPGFSTMLGVLHTLLMLAFTNEAGRIVTLPIFLMVSLFMVSTVFFSVGLIEGQMRLLPAVLGGLHGVAHVLLGIGGFLIWKQLLFYDWAWPAPPIAASVLYLPVAGVVAALLVSGYLLVAANLKVNVNELYAGQGIEDYKCFLRLHVAADGSLTVYPIGVDQISRDWVAQPTGSWFRPAKPLRPRLIASQLKMAPAAERAPVNMA